MILIIHPTQVGDKKKLSAESNDSGHGDLPVCSEVFVFDLNIYAVDADDLRFLVIYASRTTPVGVV